VYLPFSARSPPEASGNEFLMVTFSLKGHGKYCTLFCFLGQAENTSSWTEGQTTRDKHHIRSQLYLIHFIVDF
jgi:hypothetical protein